MVCSKSTHEEAHNNNDVIMHSCRLLQCTVEHASLTGHQADHKVPLINFSSCIKVPHLIHSYIHFNMNTYATVPGRNETLFHCVFIAFEAQ